MKWVRATPVSVVDLCLRPPNWHGWMKLFKIRWNWRHLPMTFSISFPNVLRRTMGLNDFRELYDFLLGLRMMIVNEDLKCDSYNPNIKHASVILMIFSRHTSSLMIYLKWLYESLSGLGVDKLLHLAMDLMNSSFEKDGQHLDGLSGISSKMLTSIDNFELNWR